MKLNLKNYKYTSLDENIFFVHNFIDNETIDKITKYAESVDESQWWINKDGKENWWVGKFLYINDNLDMQYINTHITEKIKKIFPERWFVGGMSSVHRMLEGQSMPFHADDATEDMGNEGFLQYAFVLYLSDFEGGEMVYPNLGLEYKPNKGDLLIHTGTGEYFHGTKPVIGSKIRYVGTTYAYDPEVKKIFI